MLTVVAIEMNGTVNWMPTSSSLVVRSPPEGGEGSAARDDRSSKRTEKPSASFFMGN